MLCCDTAARPSFSALQRAENSSICIALRLIVQICGFSALQRAENSSIARFVKRLTPFSEVSVLFSEPKIPQWGTAMSPVRPSWSFSALQRAENSSILIVRSKVRLQHRFQCSSASRKFLNRNALCAGTRIFRVSVLFSEPKIPQSIFKCGCTRPVSVSVLFSEPKIPQLYYKRNRNHTIRVSVLFSEPKIPQSTQTTQTTRRS